MASQFVFSAQGSDGRELWATDGTADGTHLLADINPNGSSNPGSIYVQGESGSYFPTPGPLVSITGGRVLFGADDGTHGVEPWVTDGTAEGTHLLADLNAEAGSSYPINFHDLGDGRALFNASNGTSGRELWITDGTEGGTHLLADITPGSGSSDPGQFASLGNGQVLFNASDGIHGLEPWITDGTAEGTRLLADINQGPGSSTTSSGFDVLAEGQAVFGANDGVHGYDPWVTDGTAEGTQLITDIPRGSVGGGVFSFHDMGDGRALFDTNDGAHGFEPWITDGTAGGTHLLADINPGLSSSYAGTGGYANLAPGRVLFAASDGTVGDQLWVTDGTEGGTRLVTNLNEAAYSNSASGFFSLGDGRALFSYFDESTGRELWVSDGTADGTHRVADLNPGSASSMPGKFVALGDGQALFTANDGTHGEELWLTDGTASGTQLVSDLDPGAPSSSPSGFARLLVSGSDQLVLKISQDAYQGNAQYTIAVDGEQVGGVRTAHAPHATGQSDLVAVHGDWGAGDHDVAVTFLNDAWGGSPAADRNLYVDGATYNGYVQSGFEQALPWSGTVHFAFQDTQI